MGTTFPEQHSLSRLSHRRRSQLLLLLKFNLKAYALGKGMNEADSQRVLGLLEKKYNPFDLDSLSELLRQRAKYEQDVPLQERLETEKRLSEINARIAAMPPDPAWTTPPSVSQRHSVTPAP